MAVVDLHDEGGRVPPNDLDAELAVLSACVLEQSTKAVEGILRHEHFFSRDNGRIYQALLALSESGTPIDIITLKRALEEAGDLARVGGVRHLRLMIDATPATANVVQHAEIVVDKWRLRQTIAAAQRIAAEGYGVAGDSAEFLARSTRIMEEAAKGRQESAFNWSMGMDVFAPLPPVQWVVQDLALCPGRPFQIQGYGYSGKTVAAQSLLLSVASGTPIWGHFACKKGVALHIDHEVGRRGTLGRYQRLAFAEQITPDMVGDRLRVSCLPNFRLTDADAEDRLVRECEGASVCLLDSLRATLGAGIDENASDVRLPIDKTLRVSERTGCSFILLHHVGKGRREGEAKEAGRGSSAIFDAAGTVIKMDAEKHGEQHVTISKVEMSKVTADASGGAMEPFWLRIEDIADDQGVNMRAGLRCAFLKEFNADDGADQRAMKARAEVVMEVLRSQNKGLSGREIDALVPGKATVTRRALELLKLAGKVSVRKREAQGGGWEWTVTK